ncbi:FAD-dependent oxidoreductase [Cetobacterium somerae]|uniref:FAD-dependent oxidoreductase n=1 Tax=Cetobacterium somerae TaxID=188913 RepID=UPI0022504219|nr:FAD-dependent oxidoreductase [Cetobacterium somerae]MCX3067111.1 FAD-dependent oxidoreductase [Cetobacterium somerae]
MDKIYDLIVIGGGPAGLSAGIYAGRAQMDVLIIEKSEVGGQITTTSEVVNYPGIKEISGHHLGEQMREQALGFCVEFLKSEVTNMDFKEEIKKVETTSGTYKALSVIIATGANPRKLGFPGESEFTGRGVAYCATCDGEFFTGLDVFVIGAGFAAAEEAIFLTKFARKVTIIAREPEFTCAKSIAEKVLKHPKIEVRFNSQIVEVTGDTKLRKAIFKDNLTNTTWEYTAPNNESFGVFVFIGYKPQSDLFKNHVNLDSQGYIITDGDLQTNVKDVYAVGDIRPKRLRQVVTAVADGALAATVLEKVVEEKREALGIEKEEKEHPKTSDVSKEDSKSKFLDEGIVSQLKGIFERFQSSIKIVSILNDNDLSVNIKEFLTEICDISDKITLEFYKKDENLELEKKIELDYSPTIAILDSNDNFRGVKFSGLPSGHELNSFILALYNIAGPGQELNEELKGKIQSIDKKIKLKIEVSLSCSLCPEVVTGAQRLAIENSNVQAEMIDIFAFAELKSKYNIMGVPALIINDKDISFGKQSIEEIIEKITK